MNTLSRLCDRSTDIPVALLIFEDFEGLIYRPEFYPTTSYLGKFINGPMSKIHRSWKDIIENLKQNNRDYYNSKLHFKVHSVATMYQDFEIAVSDFKTQYASILRPKSYCMYCGYVLGSEGIDGCCWRCGLTTSKVL